MVACKVGAGFKPVSERSVDRDHALSARGGNLDTWADDFATPAAPHRLPLMLYEPSSHEPLPSRPWDAGRAQVAIAAIVADAESAGAESWLDAWRESADLLWAEWRGDLWLQDLYGSKQQILGPAHGFVGDVLALAGGGLLDDARRAELVERTVATLTKYARREDGLAQWPAALQPSRSPAIRTQWCHGAPGIVASLGSVAPHNQQLTELLLAGGELTWQAGPLAKGANLCHGTAGNGYAFLKLFERTGDELWLERARGFAIHAIEQVERATAEHGRGRYSLWTGDVGTALYLQGCLTATTTFPTLDTF